MELSLNRLYFDGITNNLKDQDEKEKKNQKTSSNEDDVDFAKALSLLQAKAKDPSVISSLSFAENGKTKNTNELFSASVEPSNKEVIGTVSEEISLRLMPLLMTRIALKKAWLCYLKIKSTIIVCLKKSSQTILYLIK